MRTLTLGVLIVAGGTLAALPFRRHPTATTTAVDPVQDGRSDPSGAMAWDRSPAGSRTPGWQSGPVWASGPTESTLRTTAVQPDGYLRQVTPPAPSPHATTAQARPAVRLQRSINMPLTYEDLAVRIDPLESATQRVAAAERDSANESFSATADNYRQRVHRERLAMEMAPSTQELAVANTSGTQARERRRQYEQDSAVGPSIMADTAPEPSSEPARSENDAALASVSLITSLDRDAAPNERSSRQHESSGQHEISRAELETSEPSLPADTRRRQHYWVRQPN